jgi:hypothetical protein
MSNTQFAIDAVRRLEVLEKENAAQLAELTRISETLGTNEGHSSVTHIEILREELKDCSDVVDRQQKMLDRNAEQIAILRDALSRLVEVHDAMGGKCGTVRIAAEEALLGKAQSEYICTCGIRVTPHKCPANDGF